MRQECMFFYPQCCYFKETVDQRWSRDKTKRLFMNDVASGAKTTSSQQKGKKMLGVLVESSRPQNVFNICRTNSWWDKNLVVIKVELVM